MHSDLFHESFLFSSRDDLERLQPLSRSLLDMIVHRSNVLPLRPIQRVDMGFEDDYMIQIFVEYDKDTDKFEPDYEASIRDGDFAETFRRLQHICIKCFVVGICDSPYLRYWKAQETASFTVVTMDIESPKTAQFDVVDSIVNHLRPRTTARYVEWSENGDNVEELAALARDSFLNNLRTCRLFVEKKDLPPPTFFLNEPGFANYEVTCHYCRVAIGIDRFIESFVLDGCANQKLESVYITWNESSNNPLPAPKLLSKSAKNDLPLPKIDMAERLTLSGRRVFQCETRSFLNTKQWKGMEVHKWSAEYDYLGRPRKTHLLQCRVKSL